MQIKGKCTLEGQCRVCAGLFVLGVAGFVDLRVLKRRVVWRFSFYLFSYLFLFGVCYDER